jgi:hypothetical protein
MSPEARFFRYPFPRQGEKMAYENLFKPIRIGSMLVPNRICHVPTDISSSNADGSVSERDIRHHSQVAQGGAGLIIVGATTPDAKSGRPTVTCLVADADNFIPGLARLAESMHRQVRRAVAAPRPPMRDSPLQHHVDQRYGYKTALVGRS